MGRFVVRAVVIMLLSGMFGLSSGALAAETRPEPISAEGDVMEWPLWPTFAGLFGDGQANTPERIPGRLSVKLVPGATPNDIAPTLALVQGHVVNPERFSPNFRWITVSIPPGTEDLAKLLLERDPHVEFVEYVTPRYPA